MTLKNLCGNYCLLTNNFFLLHRNFLFYYFVAKPISAIWHVRYILRSNKFTPIISSKTPNCDRLISFYCHLDNTFCLKLRQLRCALLIQMRRSQSVPCQCTMSQKCPFLLVSKLKFVTFSDFTGLKFKIKFIS